MKHLSFIQLVKRDKVLLLLILPAFAFFTIFCYVPMGGLAMAFQNFAPGKGIFGSEWVGIRWFIDFFNSYYFFRLLRNTFLLAVYPIIFGFPIPIIFAICINEIRGNVFKKVVQNISFFPYFISTVVVVGMLMNFLSPNDGIINNILDAIGLDKVNFLMGPEYFRSIYTLSVIWQNFGFSSVIYIAAITSIDVQLYDSAKIDGANKFQEVIHIVLPGIMPTIIVMFLLNMGSIMSVGFERVYLMYNPGVYETADVISTYIYRKGIESSDFSYATAVGLFNSLINFIVLSVANICSRRFMKMSLW